jgi:hypothetical protein
MFQLPINIFQRCVSLLHFIHGIFKLLICPFALIIFTKQSINYSCIVCCCCGKMGLMFVLSCWCCNLQMHVFVCC